MESCIGRMLLCGFVALIYCAIKVQSTIPASCENLQSAALDAVPSSHHHWRGRRSAGAVDVRHTTANGAAAAVDNPCRSAVEHLGASCLQLLQSLPALIDAGNATVFVQAVERLCDDPTCMEGLNDAVDTCEQVEAYTNHTASHHALGGEFDSDLLAYVTANLSSLLHLGCMKNSRGHRCFGVLYSYQENEISCALDTEGTHEHVCTTSCRQNVSLVLDTTGCCYNSFFNTISSGNEHELHFGVWRACNVSDPGMCKVASSSPLTRVQVASTMVLLMVSVTVATVGLHG